MPARINTYKYHFKVGNKIVHTGVTHSLEDSETELQQHPGWGKGRIKQVGNITTRDNALIWEHHQAQKGKPTNLDY